MVTPYEYLRDLRNKLANRNHVEPYMILTDRTLRALASSRSRSLAEADGIPGIGPVKLHAVVPGFLDAIAKWKRSGDCFLPGCRMKSCQVAEYMLGRKNRILFSG